MTRARNHPPTAPTPPPTPQVSWTYGVVLLRDDRLFGPGRERACERFLRRVLSVEGVRSVSLDRSKGTAAIRHDAGRGEVGRVRAGARRRDPGREGLGIDTDAPPRRPGGDLHDPSPRPAVDDLRDRMGPARRTPPPPRRTPPGPRPGPAGEIAPGDRPGCPRGGRRRVVGEPRAPLRSRRRRNFPAGPAGRGGAGGQRRMGPLAPRTGADRVLA